MMSIGSGNTIIGSRGGSTIMMNGRTFTMRGRKMFVDGVEWGPKESVAAVEDEADAFAGERTLNITAAVDTLKVVGTDTSVVNVFVQEGGSVRKVAMDNGSMTVEGDINGSIDNVQGDLTVTGNVAGNVTSKQGDVTIDGSVGGFAKTSQGDIKAETIYGGASTTMGDVRYKNKGGGSKKRVVGGSAGVHPRKTVRK
jgi:hypothetical protein